MKDHENISGSWSGSYSYDAEEFQGKTIRFQMILTENDEELVGQCQDSIKDGGIPVQAKLEGFVDDNFVSLVKTYPYLIYVGENGEYLRDETQLHPEIHYYGEFDNGVLKGTWEMDLGSFNQGTDVVIQQITGKWEMKKE